MKAPGNFWPVGIIATLVLFFAGTIGLVVMACSQRSDLVRPDYYEQELAFQKQIDRADRVQHLATGADAAYDAAAKQLVISLPVAQAPRGARGQIQLYRPSEAGLDRQLELQLDAGGQQRIDAANLRGGLWRVRVNWTAGGVEYFIDRKVVIGQGLPR
jgi:nitrogen fixation protein FixH